MAEIIKGNGSFASIPLEDIGDPADYSKVVLIPFEVEFGTSAEPIRIWESGNAYIEAYHYVDSQSQHHYNFEWYPLPDWTPQTTPPFYTDVGNISTIYIGAYKSGTSGYVGWTINESNFPDVNGTLFNGLYENMDFLTPAEEWDETPSDDPEGNPHNTNPSGGEYSDRDRFDATDNIPFSDIVVPEMMFYGGLIEALLFKEYPPTYNHLAKLNEALFQASFWQNLKNRFEGLSDPLSMILNTIELPYTPAGWGLVDMKLGGIELEDSNGNPIQVGHITSRYHKYEVGDVVLKEVWGTEKDYSQCSIQIYLPYVGMRDIDTDLAVNNKLSLVLIVDEWTGDLIYLLHCSNANSAYKYMTSEFIAYRWNGNCASHVPIGRVDNSTAVLSLLSGIQKTAIGFATGGVVGGMAIGSMEALSADFSPTVQSSGNLAGSAGRLDLKKAYLVIKRSVPQYPNNWRSEIGATRYQEFEVSDLTGYTEFAEIHCDDVTGATDDEKVEIESLLKGGIFIN